MAAQDYFSEIRKLAYDQTLGNGPGVVFLGGFNSNKEGTKALHLERWAKSAGRAFLRFDYSGHGASSGQFEDGTIGRWLEDTSAILDGLTEGPQIIVGSSMGGWIGCLLAQKMPERLAGLVTVAAAPDFTEDRYWANFDLAQRSSLLQNNRVEVDSPYDDQPYVITRALIEEARDHLVLRSPLPLPCPAHILHGTADAAIPVETAQKLFEHATAPSLRMTLVKSADHRFSTPECLDLITRSIEAIAAE